MGQGSTPEEITRDRIERIKVYFESVAQYLEDDVEAAVSAILTGSAPGLNLNFAPSAPAFAGECRRQMGIRLRREELDRKPALPPPDIERTPEERARAVSAFEAWKAGQTAPEPAIVDAEASKAKAAKHQQWLRDRGELIDIEGSPYPVSRSLMNTLGYTVGDEDGDRDVA